MNLLLLGLELGHIHWASRTAIAHLLNIWTAATLLFYLLAAGVHLKQVIECIFRQWLCLCEHSCILHLHGLLSLSIQAASSERRSERLHARLREEWLLRHRLLNLGHIHLRSHDLLLLGLLHLHAFVIDRCSGRCPGHKGRNLLFYYINGIVWLYSIWPLTIRRHLLHSCSRLRARLHWFSSDCRRLLLWFFGLLALLSTWGSSRSRVSLHYAYLVILLKIWFIECIERIWLIDNIALLENLSLINAPLLLRVSDFIRNFLQPLLQNFILFSERVPLLFIMHALLDHLFEVDNAFLQFTNRMLVSLGLQLFLYFGF